MPKDSDWKCRILSEKEPRRKILHRFERVAKPENIRIEGKPHQQDNDKKVLIPTEEQAQTH